MPTIDDTFLFPQRRLSQTPDDVGLSDWREVRFPNEAGHALHGWMFAGTPGAPAILLSHGNAGNIADFLPWAGLLRRMGCPVLMYDYQGFGRSEGPAKIASLLGDGRSAMAFLAAELPAGNPVVLHGLSLGTVVSIGAAGTRPGAGGLILEGAFIPRQEIPRLFGPLGAAVAEMLTMQLPEEIIPDRHILRLPVPALFLQAENDTVTSTPGARSLYDAAPGPKTWRLFPRTGHLEPLFADPAGYERAVRDFLTGHTWTRTSADA